MRRYTLRFATVGFAVVLMVALMPAVASAAPTIRWVGPTVTGNTPGRSCAQTGYSSVQAAINAAASLDTIKVCPGTYTEQLVINTGKRLRIIGDLGSPPTIVNPNPGWQASGCNPAPPGIVENYEVVAVCSSSYVFMKNLKIQANFTSPSNVGDCAHGVLGLAVMGGGTVVMYDSEVTGASPGPSLFGCQTGIGVIAGRNTTNQVGTVTLRNVHVNGYAKGGVVTTNVGS